MSSKSLRYPAKSDRNSCFRSTTHSLASCWQHQDQPLWANLHVGDTGVTWGLEERGGGPFASFDLRLGGSCLLATWLGEVSTCPKPHGDPAMLGLEVPSSSAPPLPVRSKGAHPDRNPRKGPKRPTKGVTSPLGAALLLRLAAPPWGREAALAHSRSTCLHRSEGTPSKGWRTAAVGSTLPAPMGQHQRPPSWLTVEEDGDGVMQSALRPLHGAGQHDAAAQQENRLCMAGEGRNVCRMVQSPPPGYPW